MEKINADVAAAGGLVARPTGAEFVDPHGTYFIECFNADGELVWEDTIENLVTTVGKNNLLDTYLAGSAYTAAPFLGLKGAGTAVATDTMTSHAAWTEVTAYTGNRPAPSFSAASAGSKATSAAASFAINGTATVAGCFLVMGGTNAPGNTTGTLYSAGDFTGGSRSVQSGDTLNVTYTASA